MLTAIPLPVESFSNRLEIFSAYASGALVSILGVGVTTVGAEIHLQNTSFVVGAPCSGIRAIISLITVSAIYTYLIDERMWIKAVLMASAILFAMAANIIRISSILLIAEFYGADAALGFFHYGSDLVLFVLAVLLLMVFRRCLGWMNSRASS